MVCIWLGKVDGWGLVGFGATRQQLLVVLQVKSRGAKQKQQRPSQRMTHLSLRVPLWWGLSWACTTAQKLRRSRSPPTSPYSCSQCISSRLLKCDNGSTAAASSPTLLLLRLLRLLRLLCSCRLSTANAASFCSFCSCLSCSTCSRRLAPCLPFLAGRAAAALLLRVTASCAACSPPSAAITGAASAAGSPAV